MLRSQQSDKSTRRVDMFGKSNKFGESKVMANKTQTRCSTNNFEELLDFVMNLKMEVKLRQVLKYVHSWEIWDWSHFKKYEECQLQMFAKSPTQRLNILMKLC